MEAVVGGTPEPASGRRKRDPELRRKEILEAAGQLVVEHGAAALTHRAVAARSRLALGTVTRHFGAIDELREASLQLLSDEIDQSFIDIAAELTATEDLVRTLAELAHEYLVDNRQVHASMALVNVATNDASLRELSLQWSERLVEVLSEHVGEHHAVALGVFLDGAMVHAALHDAPLELSFLTRAIQTLLSDPEPESN